MRFSTAAGVVDAGFVARDWLDDSQFRMLKSCATTTLHLLFFPSLLSLSPQEWPYVHGKINRTEAEKRLKGCGKIGAFLVRAISTCVYISLAVAILSAPTHSIAK